jgi:phosphonate transport system substrate-binding protein
MQPVRIDSWRPRRVVAVTVALGLILASACAPAPSAAPTSAPKASTLVISGIPDQNASTLEQIFGLTARYLSRTTGLPVTYAPVTDYASIVTAFERGDVQLAWFGGLTHVQARAQVPGARAILQRPRDAEFHSVFIVGSNVEATSLQDLKGLSFTFGSESSTSGHVMPRFFLLEAGIDAERDFQGAPSFSGSHDKTYKLVESGAFQAGALNEAVWQSAVTSGNVDTSRVRVLETSPAYFDYNWTVRPDLDQTFGQGTEDKITRALLDLRADMGDEERQLLELFATDQFVPTANENYAAIETVAEKIGVLR